MWVLVIMKQSDSIGFLIGDVYRLMRREFHRALDGCELTLAQSRALVHIARGEGIRQVDLADRLEIQPMTLARQLDQLADIGLIERRADPDDRRAYQLFLTEQAQPFLMTVRDASAVMKQQAMAGLSSEQQEQLHAMLSTIRTNLCHC